MSTSHVTQEAQKQARPGTTILIIGLSLLIVGAIVGFVPLSSHGAACGSAFAASNNLYVSLTSGISASAACDSLRSIVRVPAVVFMVAGLLGTGFGTWRNGWLG